MPALRRETEQNLWKSLVQARQVAEESAILAGIGRIISSTLKIEEVYERFASEAQKLIPFDRIAVNLLNPDQAFVTVAYVSGLEIEGRRVGDVFPLQGSFCEEGVNQRAGWRTREETLEELKIRFPGLEKHLEFNLQSMLAVPLLYRNQIMGTLHFQSGKAQVYTDRELHLAENIAAQIAGAVASAHLFAESQRTQDALRESEERYRILVETSPDAIALLSMNFKILSANQQTLKFLGCERETEVLRRSFLDFIALEDWPRVIADFEEVLETGSNQSFEHTIFKGSGTPFLAEVRASLIRDREGSPKGYIIAIRDITERKRTEDQLKASLWEKEVLLKEIHHRVKNNLQVISSLLRLQSRYIRDEETHQILKESQNRIRTMALIHEKLYQSGDFSRIDFGCYLQSLTANLYHSYKKNPEKVALTTEGEDIFLGINTAIPCGLIINELASNAFKHAFPDDREGEVKVLLHSQEGQITLRVKDNGVGFPSTMDYRDTESLGLQLVMALVEQLDGTIDLRRNGGGTEFLIAFPDKPRHGYIH